MKIASLVSGPLQATAAYQAKVATSPENDSPSYQHLICVYIPDVYNKDTVTEVCMRPECRIQSSILVTCLALTMESFFFVAQVMKVLLRNHGVNLSGVKSNLYTHIGMSHITIIRVNFVSPSVLTSSILFIKVLTASIPVVFLRRYVTSECN